ncbi:hypothetical protein QFZ91_004428 [Paraburkholderia sp. JPY419]
MRESQYRQQYRQFLRALSGSPRITSDSNHLFLKEKQGKPELPERLGSSLNHSHSIVAGGLPETS